MRSPELVADGTKIRKHRELAGLTQAAVAERLKVDRSAVAHWEADRQQPTGENFRKLAKVLKTTQSSLLAARDEAA